MTDNNVTSISPPPAREPSSSGISAEDVPNILAFLSWHVPVPDTSPTGEMRDMVECGRMAILDACRGALLAQEVDRD
jgi:hypothetical protein